MMSFSSAGHTRHGGMFMLKWPALRWIKTLSILLLLLVNGYLIYRLFPLIGMVLHFVMSVAFPFVVAGIIAYLLHPIVNRCHRAGIPKAAAILMIYVAFFAAVGLLIYKGGPVFLREIRGLDQQIAGYTSMYQTNVDRVYGATPEAVHDQITETLERMRKGAVRWTDRIVGWVSGLVQSIFTLIIIPFLAFYFLKDSEKIGRGAIQLIPKKWRRRTVLLFSDMDRSLGDYIRGQLTVCAILAAIASVGLWMLGVPYPIVFGTFIGATDLIPYFGPIIGAAPALIFAGMKSVYTVGGVILLMLLIQFLEGNLIEPLIVGKSVDIHPLYIMLSLGIGGEIAGIIGMLLAIPVFLIIRTTAHHMSGFFRTIDK